MKDKAPRPLIERATENCLCSQGEKANGHRECCYVPELRAWMGARQWRPALPPPTNSASVLVYERENYGYISTAAFHSGRWWGHGHEPKPAFWMPLPGPPE